MHTNFSDGVLSPKLLVEKCRSIGLKIISITDHDSTLAYNEIIENKLNQNIKVIPGVELSASIDEREVHILGYFVKSDDEYLMKTLSDFRNGRKTRAYKIAEKLSKIGIKIDIESLILKLETESKSSAVGRLHIAKEIVRLGFAKNTMEVFANYLGHNCPAFVSRPHFTITETVELISNSGGVSFLAHPGRSMEESTLETIVKSGIDGIEVKHPSHKNFVERFYRDFARMKNLLVSGGSDYHGVNPNEENNLGNFGITENQLLKIEELSYKRK